MKKSLLNEINNTIKFLENSVSVDPIIFQELNGYISLIPDYRRIESTIQIEIEEIDGKIFRSCLIPPKEFPEHLYFDNLRTVTIGTGLNFLNKQLNSIQFQELSPNEISHIINIYGLSPETKISRAYFEITNKQISKMLNKISRTVAALF